MLGTDLTGVCPESQSASGLVVRFGAREVLQCSAEIARQCQALVLCGAVPVRMNCRTTSQNSLVAVNIGKCPLSSKG